MNNALFQNVMQHFTLQFNLLHQGLKFLFLMDNLPSHMSEDLAVWGKEHDLDLLFFPPHTSHWLQPLDQTFFSRFKQSVGQIVRELCQLPDGPATWRDHLFSIIERGLQAASSEAIIKDSWRRAGFLPFNKDKIVEMWKKDVFGPSFSSVDETISKTAVSNCKKVIASKLAIRASLTHGGKMRKTLVPANEVIDRDFLIARRHARLAGEAAKETAHVEKEKDKAARDLQNSAVRAQKKELRRLKELNKKKEAIIKKIQKPFRGACQGCPVRRRSHHDWKKCGKCELWELCPACLLDRKKLQSMENHERNCDMMESEIQAAMAAAGLGSSPADEPCEA